MTTDTAMAAAEEERLGVLPSPPKDSPTSEAPMTSVHDPFSASPALVAATVSGSLVSRRYPQETEHFLKQRFVRLTDEAMARIDQLFVSRIDDILITRFNMDVSNIAFSVSEQSSITILLNFIDVWDNIIVLERVCCGCRGLVKWQRHRLLLWIAPGTRPIALPE